MNGGRLTELIEVAHSTLQLLFRLVLLQAEEWRAPRVAPAPRRGRLAKLPVRLPLH